MKLIVCDLDGTLLMKGENALKKEVFESISNLRKKDVLFACASGRTYGELRRFFGDEDIIYIPFDGAAVIFGDKVIYEKGIDLESLGRFEREEDAVFHSLYLSYVKSKSKGFFREKYLKYSGHIKAVENLSEIDSPIYSVSLSKNKSFGFEPNGNVKKIYDGRLLSDYAESGVSKGAAVSFLCEKVGVSREELYVIGDNINDISMMNLTDNSYAVYGACRGARLAAKEEISSAVRFLAEF